MSMIMDKMVFDIKATQFPLNTGSNQIPNQTYTKMSIEKLNKKLETQNKNLVFFLILSMLFDMLSFWQRIDVMEVFIIITTKRRVFTYILATHRACVFLNDPFPNTFLVKTMISITIQHFLLWWFFYLKKTNRADLFFVFVYDHFQNFLLFLFFLSDLIRIFRWYFQFKEA